MNNQQTARITILDLPEFRDISEEEMKEIFGAGRKNSVSLGLESLERRELMAGSLSATFTSGILNINGTDQADKIVVRENNISSLSGKVLVKLQDNVIQIQGLNIKDIKGNNIEPLTKDVKSINISGNAGDDLIWVKGNFNFPITTDGGMGSDTVISNSSNLNNKESPLGDKNAKDYLVSGSIATVYANFNFDFGRAISGASVHRSGGTVQHFENFDIWVNGQNVQIYDNTPLNNSNNVNVHAIQNTLYEYVPNQNGTYDEKVTHISYDETKFFNSQNIYDKNPTLVVITHGADLKSGHDNGRGLQDWQKSLGGNTARELNISGSQVHVMLIDWAGNATNKSNDELLIGNGKLSGSKDVANHINEFLSKDRANGVQMDVMLIGHSRGAIFNFEAAKLLDNAKIGTLQMIMLDPTAAVFLDDTYPTLALKNVDQTVVYDDGEFFAGYEKAGFAGGITVDGRKISGAEYRLVNVGTGFTSHMNTVTYYATGNHSQVNFKNDISWLVNRKTSTIDMYSENTSGSEVYNPEGSTLGQSLFNISFDGRNIGVTANLGNLGIPGMPPLIGGNVSVGLDGVAVGVSSVLVGANASIGQDKVNVGVNTVIGGANGSVGLNGASVNINIGGLKTNVDIKTPQFVVNEVNNVVNIIKNPAPVINNIIDGIKNPAPVINNVINTIKNPAPVINNVINNAGAGISNIFGIKKPGGDTPGFIPSVPGGLSFATSSININDATKNSDLLKTLSGMAPPPQISANQFNNPMLFPPGALNIPNTSFVAAKPVAKGPAPISAAVVAKMAADVAAANAAADAAKAALAKAVKSVKWSDIRLKENIVKTSEISGINIYTYNYLGDSVLHRGVMAQELLGTNFADAVEMQDNGFYAVDYSLLPELQ